MKFEIGVYLLCIKDYYLKTGTLAFKKGQRYKIERYKECSVDPELCYILKSAVTQEHFMPEHAIIGVFVLDRESKFKRILK